MTAAWRPALVALALIVGGCSQPASPPAGAAASRPAPGAAATGPAEPQAGSTVAPAVDGSVALAADAGGPPVLGPGRAEPVLPGGPRIFAGHTEPLLAVALSPDGALLATGGLDHSVRVWDLKANAQRAAFGGMTGEVTALTFSPDGQWLAVGDRGFEVRLVQVSDFTVVRTALHPEGVSWLEFSPDSKWLAVSGANGTALIISAQTVKTRCEVRGRTVNFSADGKTVVCGLTSGNLAVNDAATGKELKLVPTSPHLPYTAMAGDQALVLTRNGDENDVRVWNLKTGKQTGVLKGHTAGVTSLSLTADGSRVLSGSADLSLRLWDLKTLKTVQTFSVDRLPFAVISRDGRLVAAVDGLKVKVWEVPAR